MAFEVTARFAQRQGKLPLRLFASGRRAPARTRTERAHTLSDAGLLAEIRSLNGSDARVLDDPELRAELLPMIRNDYRAIETYRCPAGQTVACPVTVFTGDADPRTSADEAADWRRHTTSDCTVHTLPGGHFYLNDHRDALVELIRQALT